MTVGEAVQELYTVVADTRRGEEPRKKGNKAEGKSRGQNKLNTPVRVREYGKGTRERGQGYQGQSVSDGSRVQRERETLLGEVTKVKKREVVGERVHQGL